MIRPAILAMIPIVVLCTGISLYAANLDLKVIITAIVIELPIAFLVALLLEIILREREKGKRRQVVIRVTRNFSKIIAILNSLVHVPEKREELKEALEELLENYDSAIHMTEAFAGIFTVEEITEIDKQRNACVDTFRKIYGQPLAIIFNCNSEIKEEPAPSLQQLLITTASFTVEYILKNKLNKINEFQNELIRLERLRSSN